MPIVPPLQVSIYRHSEDLDTGEYEEALLHAFQGGDESLGYVGGGEDLNIPLRVFHQAPEVEQTASDFLDSVPHSVTIVLLDRHLLDHDTQALYDSLPICLRHP